MKLSLSFFFQAGSNSVSRMGSRSRLGSQLGSQSNLSQGNLGSNMLLPGVIMNGGDKSSLPLNGLSGSKSKVAPMENPEVVIEVSSPLESRCFINQPVSI